LGRLCFWEVYALRFTVTPWERNFEMHILELDYSRTHYELILIA